MAPEPALAALELIEKLFGGGFERLDEHIRVSRPRGSQAEVHAFLNAERQLVVVSWLPTAEPPEHREHLGLDLPFQAAGDARRLDAQGRELTPIAIPRSSDGSRWVRLPDVVIAGGEVTILDIPVVL